MPADILRDAAAFRYINIHIITCRMYETYMVRTHT
jgi:hypothetical protein